MNPELGPGGVIVATPVPAVAPEPEPVRGDPGGLAAYLTYALAGRLTDVDAAVIRTRVADGEIEEALQVLSTAVEGSRVELTPAEARVVRACLPANSAAVQNLRLAEAPRYARFRFSPAPDGPAPRLLEAAISVAAWIDGLAGLWFTLRTSDTATAAPLWLCEARIGSDLIEITGEIQHRLAVLGEVPPRVEVFTPESPLTPYHRDALARADLVWVAADLPGLHLARTFDGSDPRTGPYFAADHLRLAGPDRARLLQYLTGAEVVMPGGGMPDVLAPEQGPVVPMAFRCDGVWIWTEPVIYYLDRYGLAPDPALTEHVLRASSLPRACSPLTRARALAAITSPESGSASVGRTS
jgi:hypothetical protein